MSFVELSLWASVALFVLNLAIRLAAVIYVPRDRRPTAGMAWLLAIFFLPVIGVLLFLLIGNPKLPESRRHKQREMDERLAGLAASSDVPEGAGELPERLRGAIRLGRHLTAMPMIGGNDARLLGSYDDSLAAMTAEIDTARTYVHVEFYILSLDHTTRPFFDALDRAVARGVTVRVLLDHWASSHCRDYKATLARLTEMGAEWELMLPVQPLKGKYQRLDLRNHRKLLVVDGQVAFTGSQNVIDRSYNKKSNIKRGLKWHELMARVEGPVVEWFDQVFITDWYMETDVVLDLPPRPSSASAGHAMYCQLVPSGPGYEVENNLQLFLELLYLADERVVITSPYFVPDESMLRGIQAATARGVKVDLFVSEIGDQALVWHAQRSYYGALLRTGVRIYCYPAPYILHSKHFSIDHDIAVIGSSNMDMRSFGLNAEVSLLTYSPEFVTAMRAVEDGYRAISKELTLEGWAEEPLRATTIDGLARLTSALQ